ncbi:alpha/beta fold hydrolase [Actinomadura sp. DC4]|uniref:alpha/beta fold hydrolase n=1 Tax=Actinomadura sp. DC4 TaxID=3055069 RepID=UPI0025B27DAA|nr:alpha/beta fold hydrolase [Actinomadura sp. DC4]MDN3351974.1 alpha/beta fold hydrolase [Actinomadura sp. DC4]
MLNLVESDFPGRDGVRLSYREMGEGRPLVLLPGLSVEATLWLQHGLAEQIATHGHRVIMPDFRGLGRAKPRDAAAYPLDVLADDGLALLDHLGLDEYDLGGYSLGGRIVVRMLVRGAIPGRAVVGGQGLRQVLGDAEGGAGSFMLRVLAGQGTFEPGSPEEQTERWLRANDADPDALRHVLGSIVATPMEAIGRVRVPALVVMGSDDERAASADALVAALPQGALAMVPGDHRTAVSAPEFIAAIVDFLGGR